MSCAQGGRVDAPVDVQAGEVEQLVRAAEAAAALLSRWCSPRCRGTSGHVSAPSLPGTPALVVYDGDKAIGPAPPDEPAPYLKYCS